MSCAVHQGLIAVQVVQIIASAGNGAARIVHVDGSLSSHNDNGKGGKRAKGRAAADAFAVIIEQEPIDAQEYGRQQEGFHRVGFLVAHQLFKQRHQAQGN